jgi:glycosyltransferase involved in cell wall biosynthesis
MSVDAQRQTISVVLTTENRARLLEGCLASVAWADEIIVVDQFSTDDTADVCGRYPQCRRTELRDYVNVCMNLGFAQATSDWVMRIDTDERITSELAGEIAGILRDPPPGVVGFEFWERPVMLGHELRWGFGRRHHRKMMWRRGEAQYGAVDSHEDVVTEGRWLVAEHGYLHLNNPTVGTYLAKTDYWTERDVERAALPSEPPSQYEMVKEMTRAFYLYYLKQRGYRDGWVGLVDATMRSVYQLVYRAKLRHRWEQERGDARAA